MTTQTSLAVDVQIACDDVDVPSAEKIESWVVRAIARSGKTLAGDTELSVRLVGTEEIRTLNRDFRQQDKVTNVLSFPAGKVDGLPEDSAKVLGDIVICCAVVSDEAAAQGKSVDDHWAHMLVHGTLHLLGYDHETDDEAARMEGLETRILMECGLTDPYVESH